MTIKDLSRPFCLQKVRGWQKNVLLTPYTTFKIGGPAKYFYTAKSAKQIIESLKLAKKIKIPVFVLGGGSNILVSDQGFNGLVIKNQISKFALIDNRSYGGKTQNNALPAGGQESKIKILTETGTKLEKLVKFSVANNLTGLEWAIGIPGTIGGAIRGNSGAFGHSISENAESVDALNPDTLKVANYLKEKCQFGYRESIFRHNKNIILSAKLFLKKGDPQKIFETLNEYLKIREQRNPHYPSVGSVFKNLQVKDLDLSVIKKNPKLKETIKGGKIPVAYLIESCGLKGKRIGDAQISEKHANFIINLNKATAEEVIILISLIKQKVRNKFGVQLEEEIEYAGF